MIDDKLKTLIPTLRQKKRYILFKINGENKFNFKEISEGLIEEIILYIGIIDFGKHGVWLLKDQFNENKQIGVLKVSTKLKDKLIGVLNIINKINNKQICIEIINVSGTLKGLRKD